MPTVGIIGGGPGGLALATQIKAFTNNKATVVIFEKYSEYQRHHVLQLKKGSFKDFPTTPSMQHVVDGFFHKEQDPVPFSNP